MATVGILHEYSDGEDWADFVERLDQYFVANMATVGDALRRRVVLLTVCGQTHQKPAVITATYGQVI